jgi:hypothetical protein
LDTLPHATPTKARSSSPATASQPARSSPATHAGELLCPLRQLHLLLGSGLGGSCQLHRQRVPLLHSLALLPHKLSLLLGSPLPPAAQLSILLGDLVTLDTHARHQLLHLRGRGREVGSVRGVLMRVVGEQLLLLLLLLLH